MGQQQSQRSCAPPPSTPPPESAEDSYGEEGYAGVEIFGQARDDSVFARRRNVSVRVRRAVPLRDALLPESTADAVWQELEPFVLSQPRLGRRTSATPVSSLNVVSTETVTCDGM